MKNYGLSLFVPYESFPYLELSYHMAQCMDKQGLQINPYKECLVIDGEEYTPLSFMDFSMIVIVNAFTIPSSWMKGTKKPMDLKQESRDFKMNGIIIFGQMIEH